MLLLCPLAFAQALDVEEVELTQSALTDDSLNASISVPLAMNAPEELTVEVTAEAEVAPFTVEQIFASEQGLTAATPANAASGLGGGTLAWIAGLAGLGLAFAGRKFVTGRLNAATKAPGRLEVLDRKGLNANSGLMLVEVETTEGGRRRLLVGIGQGSPTLVADLGGDVPGFPNLDESLDLDMSVPSARVVEELPPAPVGRFSGKFTDEDLAEVPDAPVRATTGGGVPRKSALAAMARQATPTRTPLGKRAFAGSAWSKTVDAPSSPAEAAKRLQNRKALIADVLNGRAA